jgi:hypothetical protein
VLGKTLATLPSWPVVEHGVMIDLETTYEATFRVLRIAYISTSQWPFDLVPLRSLSLCRIG